MKRDTPTGENKNQKSKPGTFLTYVNLCSINWTGLWCINTPSPSIIINYVMSCHVMCTRYMWQNMSNFKWYLFDMRPRCMKNELKDGKHFASGLGLYAFVPIGVRFGLHKTHSWSLHTTIQLLVKEICWQVVYLIDHNKIDIMTKKKKKKKKAARSLSTHASKSQSSEGMACIETYVHISLLYVYSLHVLGSASDKELSWDLKTQCSECWHLKANEIDDPS